MKLIDQNEQPVSDAVVTFQSETQFTNSNIAVMDQRNKQFTPKVLVIQQGQSVHFPNSDNIRHHVYSFSNPKPFEIKLYSGTPTEPIRFDQAGIVVLGCNIHDSMVGYIYVAENEKVALTNQQGIAYFDESSLPNNISVWHAKLSASSNERVNTKLKNRAADGAWIIQLNLIEQQVGDKKSNKIFRTRFN
ncbi:methylamine utilization protein [Catenovulum sp. 2E275]|uniref:methylamine utilization protein n=1 Tax=Catenovulum sp. 2E275 TaxID=2980497 RepID=UPI0021D12A33|nr:methylamine utilization protein [Catenovulum sp. 2E275]MCU4677225.1 methylamine utilization protein [Catenovulum sp. 2E275]